jgi:transcriptional antiterminator NusG
VKVGLEERIKTSGLQEFFSRIEIPAEEVIDVRKGKKRVSSRKFFPGYILVEMEMTDETQYLVKSTSKVTGFLGGINIPTPVMESEIELLLEQIEGKSTRLRHRVGFSEGEVVRVVEGPFYNFTGIVDEVDSERGKLKVMVSIFGRNTPLEVELSQVEKV